MTQCDRILRVLRLGPTSQNEWQNPSDGGEPIPQIARRIHDLRNRGCVIVDEEREGSKFVFYRLVAEPESCPDVSSLPTGQPAAPAPLTPLLAQPTTSRTAIDDDWDWAA